MSGRALIMRYVTKVEVRVELGDRAESHDVQYAIQQSAQMLPTNVDPESVRFEVVDE